jgi:ATP-dependent DNA ligase
MVLRLANPMVTPSPSCLAAGYAFEVKWDGFRGARLHGRRLRVRSQRGWDMTDRVAELGGRVLVYGRGLRGRRRLSLRLSSRVLRGSA